MKYKDCPICQSSNKLSIDRDLVSGNTMAATARKFDVNYNSLNNHSNNHISRQLAQAWDKKEMESSMNLLGRIDQIISRAEDIFQRNYKAKKDGLALKALDNQRNTIELLAKISYSLHQAKLAELEIQRHESGEVQTDKRDAVAIENWKVLNETEQSVLKKLFVKMQTKDKSMVVLPQQETFKYTVPRKPTTPTPIVGENQDKVAEIKPDTDSETLLRVKPVRSTQIPSSSRNNQPLNKLRRT